MANTDEQNLTKVTGYFNSNDYPLVLSLNELNSGIQLAPKQFICKIVQKTVKGKTVQEKVKVNDPIFEKFVGAAGLSREEGKNLIPIIWIPRAKVVTPEPTQNAIGMAHDVKVDDRGGITNLDSARPKMTGPGKQDSIKVYSIDEARKHGVISKSEPGRIPEEVENKVTEAVPVVPSPLPKASSAPPVIDPTVTASPLVETDELESIDSDLTDDMKISEDQLQNLKVDVGAEVKTSSTATSTEVVNVDLNENQGTVSELIGEKKEKRKYTKKSKSADVTSQAGDLNLPSPTV